MNGGAIFSPCNRYRYRLHRKWGTESGAVNFVMLNPSTAGGHLDDPTIRRCIRFAKDWGFDELIVTNLFAYRTTYPQELKKAEDPWGDQNLSHVLAAALESKQTVIAWGAHGGFLGADQKVLNRLKSPRINIVHLGLTKQRHPKHPLYLPANTPRIEFTG